jgi:hypothetical protein
MSSVALNSTINETQIGQMSPHIFNINNGLIGYWNFDDCTANDSSGNGYNGVNSGAECVDGIFGYGFEFLEQSDIVFYIPSSFDNSITNDFTITTWLYWYGSLNGKRSIIFDCRDDVWDGGGFDFHIWEDGRVRLRIVDPILDQIVLGSSIIPIEQWIHIAVVFDYTGGFLRIYLNGNEDNSSVATNIYTESDHNAAIGNNHWALGDNKWVPTQGIVDEIRIYDCALTEEEIREISEPFETHILIGKISNLHSQEYTASFNAENLRIINLIPFEFIRYTSNEKIIILNEKIGMLNSDFVFGIFKTMI